VLIKVSKYKNDFSIKIENNIDTLLINNIEQRLKDIRLKKSDFVIDAKDDIIIPLLLLADIDDNNGIIQDDEVIIKRKYLADILSVASKLQKALYNEPITILGYKNRKIE